MTLSTAQLVILAVASLAAGALNATVAVGGLVSLVALLGLGVPPHAANIANQVSTPASFAAPAGAMLQDRNRTHIAPTIAMCVGAVIGSVVLTRSANWFRDVAPYLILAAAVAVAVHPWVRPAAGGGRHRLRRAPRRPATQRAVAVLPATEASVTTRPAVLAAAMLGCGLYGGILGAGVGTVTLATLSYLSSNNRLIASVPARNVACLTASGVVAATLIVAGTVPWTLVAVVAPASLVGGALGGLCMSWFKKRDNLFRALVVAASAVAAGCLLFT